MSFPSLSWSCAPVSSSCNPSVAWAMGNKGKGRLIIKFPFALDSGWYHEQSCTKFHTFEHRKERGAFTHEFIVLKLLDHSGRESGVCRIERMGDPDSRLNALTPQGSVAYDMIQCFPREEIDQAHLDSSDVVAEIVLPSTFDILDVLKICRAIHEGEKTRSYTLQLYNCYFFSLAIQVCLTRLIANWEDKALIERWLSQIEHGIETLPDAFRLFMASYGRGQPILFEFSSILVSQHEDAGREDSLLLTKEIKLELQYQINRNRGSIQQDVAHQINNLLWHSTLESGFDHFLEEKVKEAVKAIISERLRDGFNGFPTNCREKTLKTQLLSALLDLLFPAGSGTSNKSSRSILKVKRAEKTPSQRSESDLSNLVVNIKELDFKGVQVTKNIMVDWCRWMLYHLPYLGLWFLHAALSAWGITLYTPRNFPILAITIDEELRRMASEGKNWGALACSDLEQCINRVRSLARSEVAIWDKNPWVDICRWIKWDVAINVVDEIKAQEVAVNFFSKGQPELQVNMSVSDFQNHILNRVRIQAKEVANAWLGSERYIQMELEDTLLKVWEVIREDSVDYPEVGGTNLNSIGVTTTALLESGDHDGRDHAQEAEELLDDIQLLCERQWLQKEACRDLYERHVDFQSQLRFVRNHKPHVDEDFDFCREGGKMELHTIIEFFNLLTHTAHLSKLRAIFEREKIIRALRALNEAYSRGIAHVHTFLPETHALFQPPPSPRSSDDGSRASTIGPHAPGPGGDRPRDLGRRDSAGSYRNAAGLGAGAAVTQPQMDHKDLPPLSLPPNPNPNPDMSMSTPETATSSEAAPPAYGYGFTDNKQPISPEKPRLSLERTTSNDRRAQPSRKELGHKPRPDPNEFNTNMSPNVNTNEPLPSPITLQQRPKTSPKQST